MPIARRQARERPQGLCDSGFGGEIPPRTAAGGPGGGGAVFTKAFRGWEKKATGSRRRGYRPAHPGVRLAEPPPRRSWFPAGVSYTCRTAAPTLLAAAGITNLGRSMRDRKRLGEIFVDLGVLTPAEVERVVD